MTCDSDQSPLLSSSEPSDAELVALACDQDERAFETLVRRHYRAAFAVALAYVRTRVDAEDVCHDAFIKAAERLDDCRTPDRFLQWLCAIVRNHARNTTARAFLRRAVQLLPTIAASRDDPARAVELKDLRARLESALGQLSPIQRETVLLHDLHGCSHEVIASIVGISEGMSRQHLFKARRRLRKVLGEGATVEYMND
jgi:RNA polymerase sigma-70 factor (ECF subfamily)